MESIFKITGNVGSYTQDGI